MSLAEARDRAARQGAAPHAVLGARDEDEQIFATAFDSRILRRFGGFVRPYARTLVAAILAILLLVLTQVSIPLVIRYAIDNAVAGTHEGRMLDLVVAAFAAIVVANYAGGFLQEWISARLAQRVIFDLRRGMFSHLQDVSLSFMDKTHVGRLMSRLQGDVNALQEFLETSLGAIGDVVLLGGVIVVLLSMNWRLGLLTLAVLPALAIVRIIWLPRVRATFRRVREATSIANGALAENINGIRTVQEARREAVNFRLFEEKARENLAAQTEAAWLAQITVPIVEALTGIAMAVVVVIGGNAVVAGTMDVGVMVAYTFYVQRFFEPIRTLSAQYTVMQRAMAAGYRIFEVLDVPVEIRDAPSAVALDEMDGSVEFRHVTFGYRPGQPILHDISFRAEPGQMVALVGPTGSGKTSIGALTHRFYDVWEGEVLVGGSDVRRVKLDTLGRTIAMVLQDPFIFTGSVLDNIRYNARDASREEVVRAAKAVRAHDFIMKLPEGYDSSLGQRGRNLSAGQRQLLSFARAVVADPRILILDEATASIDSFTERDIQAALKELLKGRTSIVIAHRLATVRNADRIIVLRRGRIVEQGTHEELIRERGLFAQLHASNYGSFDDVPARLHSGLADAGGDT